MVTRGRDGGGDGKRQLTSSVPFRGDKNILELDSGDGHTTLDILKLNELGTFNGRSGRQVSYSSKRPAALVPGAALTVSNTAYTWP